MTVALEERDGGTEVPIAFDGIPHGISAKDNDDGTRLSLEKLNGLVERAGEGP